MSGILTAQVTTTPLPRRITTIPTLKIYRPTGNGAQPFPTAQTDVLQLGPADMSRILSNLKFRICRPLRVQTPNGPPTPHDGLFWSEHFWALPRRAVGGLPAFLRSPPTFWSHRRWSSTSYSAWLSPSLKRRPHMPMYKPPKGHTYQG